MTNSSLISPMSCLRHEASGVWMCSHCGFDSLKAEFTGLFQLCARFVGVLNSGLPKIPHERGNWHLRFSPSTDLHLRLHHVLPVKAECATQANRKEIDRVQQHATQHIDTRS